MLLPGYDLDKAAQAVAFFAMKEGGAINVLKVSKLVYLAEREAMDAFDEPMFFDRLVSMPDGPVASVTLNFMNGNNTDERWSRFVGPRSGFDIPLARPDISASDLDHISAADLHILDDLWEKFGGLNQYQLRDWTHRPENIPEWRDPEGSSKSISHADVFSSLGKDNPESLATEVEEIRAVSKSMRAAAQAE